MPYADAAKNVESIKRYRALHPDEVRENRRRERVGLRLQTLVAYSGPVPHCACCAEDILQFLTLDHVNGDGCEERKRDGHKGGTAQYRRLRKAGWPPGYRVLCWNCNSAIGAYGACPHDEPREGPDERGVNDRRQSKAMARSVVGVASTAAGVRDDAQRAVPVPVRPLDVSAT